MRYFCGRELGGDEGSDAYMVWHLRFSLTWERAGSTHSETDSRGQVEVTRCDECGQCADKAVTGEM